MGISQKRRVLTAGLALCAVAASSAACGGSGPTPRPATSTAATSQTAATPARATGFGSGSAPGGSTGGTGTATAASAPPSSDPAAASTDAAGDWPAGRSTPVADDMYPQYGDPATDVLHYGLDLKWDPASEVLTGTATLAVRAAKPTDQFVLDLASGMTADSVSVNGAAVAGVHAGDHLTVPAGKQLAADTTVSVVVTYHGTPHVVPAPVTRPDIQGLGAQVSASGAVWSQQEPYGAFTWYPCNDQPSDKALYDVTFTVPAGWAGVTGGAFQGRTVSGGRETDRWHQPDPVATYLVAFSIDRFQQDSATGPHGIPITYWYLPADAAAVHRLTAQVPGMISFLEQHFGPYPFPTAGVVFRPERVGMETQTMITASAYIGAADLLHEFAHQWFGDAVTPTTWSGLWLNEGFAMYAQFLWQSSDAGSATGSESASLDTLLQHSIRPQDATLRRQDGPPGHYLPSHFASSNVYYCPALMLNGIREDIGDAPFYQLLNDWVHQHRGSTQDRTAFVAFVNAETGRDFAPYINAWLDSPTTPTVQPPGPPAQ